MKTKFTLSIIIALFTFVNSYSQNCQIFNGEMESWTTTVYPPSVFSNNEITHKTPDGWLDLLGTFEAIFGEQPSAGSTNDAFSGDSALKITSQEEGGGAILFQKMACGSRPISLSAALKHLNAETIFDTISVAVLLANEFEYGESDEFAFEIDSINSIGFAVIELTGTISAYKEFNTPIKYLKSEVPDSMLVLIYASNNNSNGVTQAFFDDIALEYAPLSSAKTLKTKLSLYPNPANDYLSIDGDNSGITEVKIYTANGDFKGIYSLTNLSLDISDLNSGLYIIEIKSKNEVSHHQFVKE